MSTELVPARPEQMNALSALALNGGNVKRTAEQLGMPRKTLTEWRDKHHGAYLNICQRQSQELEQRHVAALNEVSFSATETAQAYVNEAAKPGRIADDARPASTARDLMVVSGVAQDKSFTAQGRPTQIQETRDATELLRAIRSRVTVLDGEAIEE